MCGPVTIVIQPDWDQAGETALNQFVDELPESILKGYKLYTLPKPDENVKDLDEYLRDDPDTAIEKIEELFKNAISLTELRERKGEEEKEKLAKLCSLYRKKYRKRWVYKYRSKSLSMLRSEIGMKQYKSPKKFLQA